MNIVFFLIFLGCLVIAIGEQSNPRGMNIFWYKFNIKLKKYYKALTEYDSGNNTGSGPR